MEVDVLPDIHDMFLAYDAAYFNSLLSKNAVKLRWSTGRMTLCAGYCKLCSNGLVEIVLSEQLLQFRTAKEGKETLLHEMIHAYQFLGANGTREDIDREDHGPAFLRIALEINCGRGRYANPDLDPYRPPSGYNITVYHSFHDEVEHFRTHHWQCDVCKDEVRRAMNRPPSEKDCPYLRRRGRCKQQCFWHRHAATCSGKYVKTKEPEDYRKGKKKKPKDSSQSNLDKFLERKGVSAEASAVHSGGTILGCSTSEPQSDSRLNRLRWLTHVEDNDALQNAMVQANGNLHKAAEILKQRSRQKEPNLQNKSHATSKNEVVIDLSGESDAPVQPKPSPSHDEAVSHLIGMGFAHIEVEQAVIAANGQVSRALDLLLGS